jgi:hypothetical protein
MISGVDEIENNRVNPPFSAFIRNNVINMADDLDDAWWEKQENETIAGLGLSILYFTFFSTSTCGQISRPHFIYAS